MVVCSPVLRRILEAGIADGRLDLRPVDAAFDEATQAAGFRQRREGLAYRLGWRRSGVRPTRRVAAVAVGLPLRRRLIYRIRAAITAWSHRIFRLARRARR